MLYPNTLNEIETNTNPGVEYEIALFAKLITSDSDDYQKVIDSIHKRNDCSKVIDIMNKTNLRILYGELVNFGFTLEDASFETQNDNVGPADIVLTVIDKYNIEFKLGLSIKYANKNTLNPTARRFLTDSQISVLNEKFENVYIPKYLEEMKKKFGNVNNWKRKRSVVADAFYDLMRNAVIENWPNICDKTTLLATMFHANSPIPFWVINYNQNGYTVETIPETIDESRANDIKVEKYRDCFVAFKLDGRIIGKVQVKCNNGFIEDQFNHAGKAKKKTPDFIIDGAPKIKGKPFGSWDFTLGI
ncbi:MAG: hypothetical protein J6W43_10100 [Prevotella sp.]|nr:hypothetical protein [Prevotella sp.]